MKVASELSLKERVGSFQWGKFVQGKRIDLLERILCLGSDKCSCGWIVKWKGRERWL